VIDCRLLANAWEVSCCNTELTTMPWRLMKKVSGSDVMR
jgi:hypothetical protein